MQREGKLIPQKYTHGELRPMVGCLLRGKDRRRLLKSALSQAVGTVGIYCTMHPLFFITAADFMTTNSKVYIDHDPIVV